jgi:hypothetical protein
MIARTSSFQVLKFPLLATPERRFAFVLPGVYALLALGFFLLPLPAPLSRLDFTLSCILSLMNAFLGYVFNARAFRMNMSLSILIMLGGQVLRFFLILGAIGLVLVSTPVGIATFVGSFMVMYTVTLFGEVLYINYKTEQARYAKIPVRK